MSRAEGLQKLAELIADVRVAMLYTMPTTSDGSLAHVRPMYTQSVAPATFDGELWFMTGAGSQKVDEIARDSRVVVTYAAPGKNRYVAIHGTASCEQNPTVARELWNVHAKGWWPEGPDSPDLRLIRVHVDRAEYWDGPSNVAYMLDLARAVVTGDRVRPGGEHGTISGAM